MIARRISAVQVLLGDNLAFTTKMDMWRVEIERRYVGSLYNAGEKVKAIKHAREVFGTGLKEAKYFAEQAAAGDFEVEDA